MARYKVLRSVAHAVGHSFSSLMNFRDDDYVMGHLLTRARETQESTLRVNLLNGNAVPSALLSPPVISSLASCVDELPRLLRAHGTDLQWVRAAHMTVTFDLTTTRRAPHAPDCVESPFVCRVELEDDRGKLWVKEQRGWWFPEPSSRAQLRHGVSGRSWLAWLAWQRQRWSDRLWPAR